MQYLCAINTYKRVVFMVQFDFEMDITCWLVGWLVDRSPRDSVSVLYATWLARTSHLTRVAAHVAAHTALNSPTQQHLCLAV